MAGNDVTEIEDHAASSGIVVRQDHPFYSAFLRFVATMKKFWVASNARDTAIEASVATITAGLVAQLNVRDMTFNAAGMPANLALAVTGGARYKVTVSFLGLFANTNGTTLQPQISVYVKNGATVLANYNWVVTVPVGYNNWLGFTESFDIVVPGSVSLTIQFADTEFDGGSHSWANCSGTATANFG